MIWGKHNIIHEGLPAKAKHGEKIGLADKSNSTTFCTLLATAIMKEEIHVRLDGSGQYQLKPVKNGKALRVYLPDLLEKHGGDLPYVFENPATLRKVVESVSTKSLMAGVAGILQNMHRLRLCVSDELERPLAGRMTCTDEASLLKDWQDALRSIPSRHRLQEIQLDFGAETLVDMDAAARFSRQVQMIMQQKGGQHVMISPAGCSEKERMWLKDIMQRTPT